VYKFGIRASAHIQTPTPSAFIPGFSSRLVQFVLMYVPLDAKRRRKGKQGNTTFEKESGIFVTLTLSLE